MGEKDRWRLDESTAMITVTQEDCETRIRDYAKRKIQNAGAKVTEVEDEPYWLIEFPNGKRCRYYPISGRFEDFRGTKMLGQFINPMLKRGGLK